MDRAHQGLWARIAAGIVVVATLSVAALPAATAAQEAIPAATPVPETDLDERIGEIAPEALLEALLDTPVEEGLFPSEYADVVTQPWVNEVDTDLEGVVGGVLVTSGDTLLGVYIVHPSEESATARFEETLVQEATPFEVDRPTPPERVSVADLPAWLINTDEIDDTLAVLLRVENVILGSAVTPGFATPVSDPPAATPASADETLTVAEGLVNLLDRVVSDS